MVGWGCLYDVGLGMFGPSHPALMCHDPITKTVFFNTTISIDVSVVNQTRVFLHDKYAQDVNVTAYTTVAQVLHILSFHPLDACLTGIHGT